MGVKKWELERKVRYMSYVAQGVEWRVWKVSRLSCLGYVVGVLFVVGFKCGGA